MTEDMVTSVLFHKKFCIDGCWCDTGCYREGSWAHACFCHSLLVSDVWAKVSLGIWIFSFSCSFCVSFFVLFFVFSLRYFKNEGWFDSYGVYCTRCGEKQTQLVQISLKYEWYLESQFVNLMMGTVLPWWHQCGTWLACFISVSSTAYVGCRMCSEEFCAWERAPVWCS